MTSSKMWNGDRLAVQGVLEGTNLSNNARRVMNLRTLIIMSENCVQSSSWHLT